MKKVITLLFVLLVASSQSTSAFSEARNTTNTFSFQQSKGWESLGNITAISYYGKYESFGLFAKNINGVTYYSVRHLFNKGGYIPEYRVSLGKYNFRQKTYNAKFTVYETVYYFNL